jgi:bifunctional non-homologous end joining protein LigD
MPRRQTNPPDSLGTYREKRDFARTPEPAGKAKRRKGDSFLVQKHSARRLHYDLRLELDGVLKSWAVAKGPSLVAGEKRLAVRVEDHPLEYGTFEGIIPAGEYGGGTVLLWDRGRWAPEGDPHEGLQKGRLSFRLDGEKLKGAWHLVRMRRRPREKKEQWLLIKSEDEAARPPEAPDILEERPESVASGRSTEEIAAEPHATWSSKADEAPPPPKPRARARRKKPALDPAGVEGAVKASLPRFVEPCLATLVAAAPHGSAWIHEIKFDGYRLQAHLSRGQAKLLTRRGHDWTARFAPVGEALAQLPVTSALLDGEVVVEDETGVSSFTALQTDLEAGRSDRFVFYAFDLLHLDGYDLRAVPLKARKRLLSELAGDAGDKVRLSEHLEDGEAMFRHACRLGLEGTIAKRADSLYRSGRQDAWRKVKCVERQEFVIGGYTPSSTSRKHVASLLLGYYEGDALIHVGRVGTGIPEPLARDLWQRLEAIRERKPPFAGSLSAEARRQARFVAPLLVAEIEFRGWTGDGNLRHASFKGLREDKEPKDVVREDSGRQAATSQPATLAGVHLTHPERVLWEGQGVTKQGLAEFYAEIADWILPHVVNRPLALKRCPSGVKTTCFFQKHAWAGLDETVRRVEVSGDKQPMLAIDDLRGLLTLVQAGVLEIHPWGATLDDLERPDRITFDLDPAEDVAWEDVIAGAQEVRERLNAMSLVSFLKTTGGKGLHVVLPLTPKADWAQAKAFAEGIANAMAADSPDRYTATLAKSAREGRIFIDYLRNARGATAIAAYSSRARPGAPVATPIAWEELGPELRPDHFTVVNLPSRLRHLAPDPWEGMASLRQTLPSTAKDAKPAAKRRRG